MAGKQGLANGLRIVTEEMPHMKSAAVCVWIGAGSRYERQEINGISHFIEHLLFKGTKKRPDNQKISQAIEGIGGMLNGFTNKEATCYIVKVPSEHLGLGLDVLSDMVNNSLLEPEALDRERTVVIEEIRMVRDKPDHWVHILFDGLMWPGHPLGRSISGTEDVIKSLTRDDILDYMDKFYVPSNMLVSLAGNFNTGDVLDEVTNHFPVGEREKNIIRDGAGAVPERPRVDIEKRDTQQANLLLGVRAYHRLHPDRYALEVLNVILGWGMSSRLFQEVRVKRGLAYAVGTQFQAYMDTGAFKVYMGVDPKKGEEALEVTLGELERIKKDGVAGEEIQRAKDFYKGNLLLRLEDTLNSAIRIGESELMTGEILTIDEVIERIYAVTPEDVHRVANDLFLPERFNLAAVGPFEDIKVLAAMIGAGIMPGNGE